MKRSVEIFLHLVYWSLYAGLLSMFYLFLRVQAPSNPTASPAFTTWMKLMTGYAIVPGALAFYTAYLYVYPDFLRTRKLLRTFLFGLASCVLGALGGMGSVALIMGIDFLQRDNGTNVLFLMVSMTLLSFINAAIGMIINGFVTGYGDIYVKLALEKKNRELERELIKLQLDPHFLFNTINNIDILIAKDPAQASAYLNKLSEMMRFMLYDTKATTMPLTTEIDYIHKYLALQKLRTAHPEQISLHVYGDPTDWTVDPMLFIPFIENAFKHYRRGKQGFIRITTQITNDTLAFECTNSCYPTPQDTATGGIGKTLIARRLEHAYPEKHRLNYTRSTDTHTVNLSIWQ